MTTPAADGLRVLIADDQEMVRVGLRMMLEAEATIDVVAEAADGIEAVARAEQLRPDVCLVDIRMPGLDGIEVTRRLAGPHRPDPIPVVVVTTFDDDEYVFGALDAGAGGFLLKSASAGLVVEAVRAAVAGDVLIEPAVTARLVQRFARPVRTPPEPVHPPLSEREEEVLAAVAAGWTNPEIARQLHLSVSTVKSHVNALLTKVEARNRVALAIWAHRTGRSDPGP